MKKSDKTFKFELVTPDIIVVSGDVAMALLQGDEGEFGVLPDHSSLLAGINPGIITIHSNRGDVKKFYTSSGFADVNETNCSVLVEKVEDLDELDENDLRLKLREYRAKAKGHVLEADEMKEVMSEILHLETIIRAKKSKNKSN